MEKYITTTIFDTREISDTDPYLTKIEQPIAVAVDADDNVIFTNYAIKKIKILHLNGEMVHKIDEGKYKFLKSILPTPISNLFKKNDSVKETSNGTVYTLAASWKGTPEYRPPLPYGIAIESHRNIFYTDVLNHNIKKIDKEGHLSTVSGGGGPDGDLDSAVFHVPIGICVDSQDNLIVSETGSSSIRYIDLKNQTVSTIGGTGEKGFRDGPSKQALFCDPAGVAVDFNDDIFVCDTFNNAIRKIDRKSGIVSTIYRSSEDSKIGLKHPHGIALDSVGNIFVADTDNHEIKKITSDGVISKVAGSGSAGFRDGIGGESMFNTPYGICVYSQDNLIIADSDNDRVRKIISFRVHSDGNC